LNLSRQQVIQLQQNDLSLVKLFDLAKGVKYLQSASHYSLHEGALVRTWCNKMQPSDTPIMQIFEPTSLHQKLISVAYDQISSDHLGVRKTLDRLQRWFYWPAVNSEVKKYVRSSDISVNRNRN